MPDTKSHVAAPLQHGTSNINVLRQSLRDYAVILLDPEGRIVDWSAGAERIFGYRESEVLGRHFELIFTPEDRAANAPATELSDAARGEAAEDRRWHMRKDAVRIWVSGLVRAIYNESGEITGYSKIAREVTSHKETELQREALLRRERAARIEAEREKERRAAEIAELKRAQELAEEESTLLDLAQDAILALSPEGTVEFWNRGAEKMYGWSREEALGRDIHSLLRTEFPVPLRDIENALQAQGNWRGDLKHVCRGGRVIEVSSRWALRTRDGVPHGWLEINRDITERKRLEAHVREAQKQESIGALAGGIAHDFNNLLMGIMGNISMALELTEAESRISSLLVRSLRASEQAALLIRQLLAYAGKGQFVIRPVDLISVVQETISLLGGLIPENVRLHFSPTDALPPIEGDVAQLHQVAMNLILNAVEAVGPIEGHVSVKTSIDVIDGEVSCDVGNLTPGTYVVLAVEDTGAGIESSARPKIFDPFFTTRFTGRGLGLAAVSGVVRAFNGAVQVESAPGQGTAFRVFFPVPRPEEPAPSPPIPAHHQTSHDLVLVVDDDEIVRDAIKSILERNAYDVVVAANGKEAVDVFRQNQDELALVLLDMTMPVMGGAEALRELKAIRPEIPVVISSGYSLTDAAQRFGDLVAGFLEKPYTLGTLLRKIEEVLKRQPPRVH